MYVNYHAIRLIGGIFFEYIMNIHLESSTKTFCCLSECLDKDPPEELIIKTRQEIEALSPWQSLYRLLTRAGYVSNADLIMYVPSE